MEYHDVYVVLSQACVPDEHKRHPPIRGSESSELSLFVETEADGGGYLHKLQYSPLEHLLKLGVSHHYRYERKFLQDPEDASVIQSRAKCGVTPKRFYPDEWDVLLKEPPTCLQWGFSYWEVGTLGGNEPPIQSLEKFIDAELRGGYEDAVKSLAAAGLLMEKVEELSRAPPLRTKEMMFKAWEMWSLRESHDGIMEDPVLNRHNVPWQPEGNEGWPRQIVSTNLKLCVIAPRLIKMALNDMLRFAMYLSKTQAKVEFDEGDVQINRYDETTHIQIRAEWKLKKGSVYDCGEELDLNHAIRMVIGIFRDWYYARLAWSERYPDAQRSPTPVAPEIMEAMEMLSSAPKIEEVWDLIDRIDTNEELSMECDPESELKWPRVPSLS